MANFDQRRAAFRKLHESGCFVIPNPWDVGTARYLRRLGFKALATTSSGFSFSQALPDMDWAVPVDMALGHIAEIVAATELPVNADFESGYAHEPEGVAANVKRCVATGVAGLSIEDASGDKDKPLYDQAFAVERIAAARAAIDASGADVLLTARAECFLVGHPDPLRELDPPADGLRRGRRRRALRPRPAQARRHPGDRRGGRAEAGERAHGLEYRAHRLGPRRRSGCAASASARRSRAPPGPASSGPRS